LADGLSGKSVDAVIHTSMSGPVVISRGGTSRVPVVRPLLTSGAARSRVQSSVIRTTVTRASGSVAVTSSKALRNIVPAASVIASRAAPSSAAAVSTSSQLVSVSRLPKTATVTRVHSSSKLVTGHGSVSLIQVRPNSLTKVTTTQGQKVVPGQKVAPVQAMIEPVKPATIVSSSGSISTSASLRPLGEATVSRADTAAKTPASVADPVQASARAAAAASTDRLSDFDGLLTSALDDLDDFAGPHTLGGDFSRPVASATPTRGGPADRKAAATEMPLGYGYAPPMDRQFQMPMQNPYLPYGMPPPAYPWMPPALNMNPLWMQQPMSGQPRPAGTQPIAGQVIGSSMSSRAADGFQANPSDNFDFGDGASFEPLGSDVNRSLTSLLADSEPPGYDMNFGGRRTGRNTAYTAPSYPGPPMMSGYHPYHPYPMPYSAAHPSAPKPHYYPPPPPSANSQFGSPPGSGFGPPGSGYFPMHYPGPAGIYPGSGAPPPMYLQPPGSGMMPAAPSYGLPGHSMGCPPSAGESLTEFLLKNE